MLEGESEQDKRKKIKEIRDRADLNDNEKNVMIQNLIYGNYEFSEMNQIVLQDNFEKRCSHFVKSCYKNYFECCGVYDCCIICHKLKMDKKCDGFKVSKISCVECDLEQELSNNCIQCGTQFGNNYCPICFIWTSETISHCNDCGICLKDKSENLLHCFNCKKCYYTRNKHICREQQHTCCAACGENIDKSVYNNITLGCSHVIDNKCYQKMKTMENYRCPLCKKSMWNMREKWEIIKLNIIHTPMPNDFVSQKYVSIHCNDCGKNSTTQNHYYGLECKPCGSFNTQI